MSALRVLRVSSNWGIILVTEMAVTSENQRDNGNNHSSGINDGAQRTLATTLVVAKHLVENN